jgi:hypothetical protein
MSTQASPQRRRRAISDAPLPPTPTTWIFSPLPKQASHERSLSPASPAAASVAESLKSSHQPSREDEGQAGRDQQNREPQKKEEPSVEILVMKCCFFPGKEKERLVVLSFGLSKATRQLRSFSSVPDCIRGVLNVKKWCRLQRAMLWGRDRSKDVAKLASIADGLCSNGMPKWYAKMERSQEWETMDPEEKSKMILENKCNGKGKGRKRQIKVEEKATCTDKVGLDQRAPFQTKKQLLGLQCKPVKLNFRTKNMVFFSSGNECTFTFVQGSSLS